MTVVGPRFVFVTGGVVSSVGKGIAAASIGALLLARGFSARLKKLEPYINVDPGTINPYKHGEVYVTDDGGETDLDMGHYERFTGIPTRAIDLLTTGKVYSSVIARERKGDYLGSDIQVVPHITDEIKRCVLSAVEGVDFVICEVGGTVGDIESLPFLEAIRQLRNDLGPQRSVNVHLTLLPYIASANELKTKPSQHSVRELLRTGIQPEFLICRSSHGFEGETRKKLSLFCNIPEPHIVDAPDENWIYQIPLNFHKSDLDGALCRYFSLSCQKVDLKKWEELVTRFQSSRNTVRLGVFGKYAHFLEAYKSLQEAIVHAGGAQGTKVEVQWVETEDEACVQAALPEVHAMIVPGGFGSRGIPGKLRAIQYARENKIPFLGICLGMQLAIIEAARHLLGLPDASSTEFGETPEPVIALMTEWMQGEQLQRRTACGNLGGTMRLGAYPCVVRPNSKLAGVYDGKKEISERHRHRYEVNSTYLERLEKVGLCFSGWSPDGDLPEAVEYTDHPWFLAVQYHPEFKSRPFAPHPLFVHLVQAALRKKKGAQ
ncbi:MAG: CTP synthase [Holosporales bacterium]|jgi:CTP synthase|nr:CTP synthase [Holosporales bacterium]